MNIVDFSLYCFWLVLFSGSKIWIFAYLNSSEIVNRQFFVINAGYFRSKDLNNWILIASGKRFASGYNYMVSIFRRIQIVGNDFLFCVIGMRGQVAAVFLEVADFIFQLYLVEPILLPQKTLKSIENEN